jgi:ERCC4-type nuclease
MRLIIDIREQGLIEKCQNILANDQNYVRIETESLPIGDILIKTDEGKDVLLVERKSLQDLLASIKDGRYEEQSHRLKHASGFIAHNVIYLIEGMFSTLRTALEKKLVMSAMTSLLYFKGFSVIRTSGLQETAEVVLQMADKIDRNFMKGLLPWYLTNTLITPDTQDQKNEENQEIQQPKIESYSGLVKKVKKENITPDNMGEILLCQIPGISSQYAQVILKHFGGFSQIVTKIKGEDCIKEFDNIFYETKGKQRRIPRTCGEEITRYFKNL